MRKFIYTLLDILLILGAITSVVTIDGGRWVKAVVDYYQPRLVTDASQFVESALLGTGGTSAAQSSDHASPECLYIPMPGIAGLSEFTSLVERYNGCEQAR